MEGEIEERHPVDELQLGRFSEERTPAKGPSSKVVYVDDLQMHDCGAAVYRRGSRCPCAVLAVA